LEFRSELNSAGLVPPLALTIADAVRVSGLSRSTVYRLIGEDLLDSRVVAGRRLILYGSLQALITDAPRARAAA
jgi:hypothetical protein